MLEVRDQAPMPFRRMLEVCLDSIYFRLLRSLVTLVIVILAIAFLASIMTDGYLGRALRKTVSAKTLRYDAFRRFLSELNETSIGGNERLVRRFARVNPGSAEAANLARWGGFADEAQTAEFIRRSADFADLMDFFDNLKVGNRVLLVRQNRGLEILDWLTDSENRENFYANLAQMPSLRLPGGKDRFNAAIEQWSQRQQQLAHIRDEYILTIRRIADYCGEGGVGAALSNAAANHQTREFFNRLDQLGYGVNPDEIEPIVAGRQFERDLDWAFDQLRRPVVSSRWFSRYQEDFNPGGALASCAASSGRTDWVETNLREGKLDADWDRSRFEKTAGTYVERENLRASELFLTNRYGESDRLSSKTIWLIFVSFLVCIVGIANAMLMSVLERFKEIATMKCLGARNSTIGLLFVAESTILGVIGGVIGMILGFLIIFARETISYSSLVFQSFPTGDILYTLLICFACSLTLASMAAIYPAWVAARMAPMEAMRVD